MESSTRDLQITSHLLDAEKNIITVLKVSYEV